MIIKNVYIIALHLAYGGIEKAVSQVAGLLCEKYNVRILSVYNMPGAPAYEIDSRVKIEYLLSDTPNRQELDYALKMHDLKNIIREGIKAARILINKKRAVIKAVKSIDNGIVITTRNEHNVLLSKYGRDGVLKIAQMHEDHRCRKNYFRDFRRRYKNIDIFMVLTPKLKDEVSAIMRGRSKARVEYVPNFADDIRSVTDPESRELTVISVGRLHPVKGFDRLIKCFSAVHATAPEWKLEIIGDGEEYHTLSELIKALGAEEYISLKGKYTPEEVNTALSRASLYAMTSYSEGFPFVLLEALTHELPIIAYDSRSSLAAMVRDGDNGYLLENGNEESFCNALKMLLTDKALLSRMSASSKNIAEEFRREELKKVWYRLLED